MPAPLLVVSQVPPASGTTHALPAISGRADRRTSDRDRQQTGAAHATRTGELVWGPLSLGRSISGGGYDSAENGVAITGTFDAPICAEE